MIPLTLTEIKDGLLGTSDKVLMKARDPRLFPENIQAYFADKTKALPSKVYLGEDWVTVATKGKTSFFDTDMFEYIRTLGRVDCYLSNVPLPNNEVYPLFVKYRYGWVVLAPLEV